MEITPHDPESADVRALIARHLAFSRASTPPEASYAQPPEGLRDVAFYGGRVDGQLVAIGALRRIDPATVELKSMHVAAEMRGRRLGHLMLAHLLAEARRMGCRRAVLETGTSPAFVPANALYVGAGFTPCEPYGDYAPSEHNAFYALDL